MRKIRDVLRMKFELCLKDREIARSCSIPHSSVANYLERAKEAGLSWPLPAELDDEALERRLFGVTTRHPAVTMPLPDFSAIRAELRADRHVTLQLLWQEYKQNHPEGYQYSRFCELYGRWERKLDPVLRQDYRAGERLFVDHAGRTLTITDRETGRTGEA
ncbi:MAG: transposase, partial [Acidobacteria bacterium]